MEPFPEKLAPFHPSKVPTKRELVRLKLRKLLIYGLMTALPVVVLLLSIPRLREMSGTDMISYAIAIPFIVLLIISLIFAYVNKSYNEKLQYYAAYKSFKPILENLSERPRQIMIALPTLGETLVTGTKVKEFVMTFPSAPEISIYYYDGRVSGGLERFTGRKVAGILRVRSRAKLKRPLKGRIYLPHWGCTDEATQLAHLKRKISLAGLPLLKDEPEPSRIEFDEKNAYIVLSMPEEGRRVMGRAVDRILDIYFWLRREGVV